jgi:predicted  nucleic acid-binding Zn-ribbon protein
MFVSENSVIGGFGLGVVALLLVGIGLSAAVNKRFTASSGQASIERQIAANVETLSTLEGRIEKTQARLQDEAAPKLRQKEDLEHLAPAAAQATQQLAKLRDSASDLRADIARLTADSRTYRDKYREQARQAAIGEKVPDLTTRSGKTFQNGTITEVSALGMTVRHDVGLTRLRPEDLDSKWTERFQWSAEEQQPAAVATPAAPVATPPAKTTAADKTDTKTPPKKETAADTKTDPAAAAEIASVRKLVLELEDKLTEAEGKLADTRAQAANARSRSAPGSLQTWEDRINALAASVSKLDGKYQVARQNLARLSPRDPALQRRVALGGQ